MKISLEVDEITIRQLIADHINKQLGDLSVKAGDVYLLVRSKQNYKSTWESAGVLATNQPEEHVPKLRAEVRT